MMKKFRSVLTLVWVSLILAACSTALNSCGGQQAADGEISALADRANVFIVRSDGTTLDSLAAQQQAVLVVGEGVDVDEAGRAILQFADLLTVEVLRDGELTVQALDIDDQNAAITIFQNGGALLNNFDAEAEIAKRFTINTEFASISAVGTEFLVVREPGSPLEWVLALNATPNDLVVTSNDTGVPKDVQTTSVRWVAPIGDPSSNIQADMANVQKWLQESQAGINMENFGDIVWAPADVAADAGALQVAVVAPAPGVSYAFEGVQITLGSSGQYWQEDCNYDGIPDVAMQGGSLEMDFRNVLARVRALDVSVLVRNGSAWLTVLDPAKQPIETLSAQAWPSQVQVLSARHTVPYHYAELRMDEGCFLGFVIPPPNTDGSPADAQPAIQQLDVLAPAGDGGTPPAQTVFRRPPENGEFSAPFLPINTGAAAANTIQIDGLAEDWVALSKGMGVPFVHYEQIVYDVSCQTYYPGDLAGPDLQAETMFAYDQDNLFAVFIVHDESFVPHWDVDALVFNGDAPQIILDTDLEGDFDDPSINFDDIEIDLHPGFADGNTLYRPFAAFWRLGNVGSLGLDAALVTFDFPIASTLTPDGYIVEAAIPWSLMGVSVKPGSLMGVAASVSDNDNFDANEQECMISSTPIRDYTNPTTWGTLVLMALP